MADSREKLDTATVGLHWIIAVCIVALLVIGFYMSQTRTYPLWNIHKSLGSVVLVFVLIRTVHRLRSGWLAPVSTYSSIEQKLAKVTHWGLLLMSLVMPLTGIVSSLYGGYAWDVFGLELVAQNVDPAGQKQVVAYSESLHENIQQVHKVGGYVLASLVLLHIAGALKHHFVDRDGTLRRMLGTQIS